MADAVFERWEGTGPRCAQTGCVARPRFVVLDQEGQPRPVCGSGTVETWFSPSGSRLESPEGLDEELLRAWLECEKREQYKQRERVRKAQDRLAASEERIRRVRAVLDGQPELAL